MQSFRIITFFGEVWDLLFHEESHCEILIMPHQSLQLCNFFEPAPQESNAWYSPKSNFNDYQLDIYYINVIFW